MTEGKEIEQVFEAELATYVVYDSNNSGGSFWLNAEDWKKLIAAGWIVNRTTYSDEPGGASRYGLSLRQAIEEFAEITGQDPGAQGCNCCGPPHSFEERDIATDKYIRSMTHVVEESWDV